MSSNELISSLNKYIASFDELVDNYDGNLYKIQEKYIKENIDYTKLTFNPIKFLATNAKEILSKCKNGEVNIFNKKYKIFIDSKITSTTEDNITNLFIESRLNKKRWKRDEFDSNAYNSQYYYLINEYFYNQNIDYKAERFYVEYGFYNNLHLEPINGLIYLASLNDNNITDENQALNMYFTNKKETITFNPYVYIVSNFNTLKHIIGGDRCINEKKVTKHYIVTGRKNGLSRCAFDHYKYLANNIKLLNNLMLDENGNKKYDIVKINVINVAKIFILKNGKTKDTFNPVEFVRLYFDDDSVNYDKKLCIDNAHIYFVRTYVLYNYVRWRNTHVYKTLQFIRNRIYDGVRQFPFHAIRFMICSR